MPQRGGLRRSTTPVANAEGLIVQSQVVNNNNPATGTVRITGTPRLGWTLETHGRGIADAEGRRGALYFQWIRLDPVTEVEQNVSNPEAPGVWWSYVVQEADVGKAIKVRVSFTDNAGNAESVTSDAVAGPYPLTATTHDAPGSHDGSAAFSFELWFSEAPAVGFATVRDHAFTVTEGSVDNVRRLVPGNNARWEITVTPSSEADVTLELNATTKCSAEGAICNVDGVKLSGVLELVVPGPSSNSTATGAPTIGGTARVGESLTASTSDIADADGLANASFTYQWLADDLDISGATGSSYTVVTADAGKVIKVTVSFTDDAGNEESVTSAATAVVTQPPLTASTHDVPESHDGATAFTFELRFSEEPGGGFSATTLRDQALTVSGGTITNVRQLETGKNLKWEITLQPSGNEEVTVILLPTIDCADHGAICTGDGRGLSVGQAILVLGPPNSAASGAPAINGTAQVGEILTASTSGRPTGPTHPSPTSAGTIPISAAQRAAAIPWRDGQVIVRLLHRRRRQCRDADHAATAGAPGGQTHWEPRTCLGGHRSHHQRHGAGGREPDRLNAGHIRFRRLDQRILHLPVARRRHCDQRRNGEQLHRGCRRRGQGDHGDRILHGRRRQCRDSDQRGDGGGHAATHDGHVPRRALVPRRERRVHLRAAVQRGHRGAQLHHPPGTCLHRDRGLGEQRASAGAGQERQVGDHRPRPPRRPR